MEATGLERRIAALRNDEVEVVLNRLIAADAAQHGYERRQLYADESSLATAVTRAAADVGVTVHTVREIDTPARVDALRALLAEIATRPELQASLESALDTQRKTLLEPVTSALVLSGIILVLSLDVDLKYENKDGKKHVLIHVKKRPTAARLLEKIAKFF